MNSVRAPVQAGLPPERARIMPGRAHLGFDLGTCMGWAALDDKGRRIQSGTWDFTPRKAEHPGVRWVRVANRIGVWIGELLRLGHTFRSLAYENVVGHRGLRDSHMFGGMEAMLQAQAHRYGLDLDRVSVSQLKLIATGAGGGHRADKDHIKAAARSKWPHLDIDAPHADDEADSLWIAELHRRRTLQVRW